MNDSSKLPLTFLKRKAKFTSSTSFSNNDISRIIRELEPNKDSWSWYVCGESISKPLGIFKSCIEKGQFPNEWEKANVVPVHKKR